MESMQTIVCVHVFAGSDVSHVVANVLAVYTVLLVLGGSAVSVAICFVINIVGFFLTARS